MRGLLPVPRRSLRYRPTVSDRAHNTLLDLLAVGLGLGGIYVLADIVVFGEESGFGFFRQFLVGLFVLAVARGFKRRKGWAFLVVSVGLLVGWMVQMIRAIVLFDVGGAELAEPTVISFIVITALIAYLGRWSMERRFRPHLDVDWAPEDAR